MNLYHKSIIYYGSIINSNVYTHKENLCAIISIFDMYFIVQVSQFFYATEYHFFHDENLIMPNASTCPFPSLSYVYFHSVKEIKKRRKEMKLMSIMNALVHNS